MTLTTRTTMLSLVAIAAAAGCEAQLAEQPELKPDGAPQCTVAEMDDIYGRYIEPIVADPASQSCAGCHPAAVSINMWVKGSPCRTMACMVEREVIDLDTPDDSRVFGFIEMSDPDDIAVQREHDGFVAWIDYMATCGMDACGDFEDPCDESSTSSGNGGSGGSTGSGGNTGSGGGASGPMIGNCLESDVLDLWVANMQTPIEGCKSCHDPAVTDPELAEAGKWIALGMPLATLKNVIATPNMLNPNNPNLSEIITKPLHQGSVPSYLGTFVGVEHGGLQKLSPAGMNFQQRFDDFVEFIDFYSQCMNP